MQKERGSSFHFEGASEFQFGDVLERGRERGREGCMGERVEAEKMDSFAEKLGSKLVQQR